MMLRTLLVLVYCVPVTALQGSSYRLQALATSGLAIQQDAAGSWMLHSRLNTSCGITQDGNAGDCAAGDAGSWNLGQRSSWVAAAEQCLALCSGCARCRFVSITLWASDCSWYSRCDQPVGFVGARSGGAAISAHQRSKLPAPQAKLGPARFASWRPPPSFRLPSAIALQVSGHFGRGCRTAHLASHVDACRRRFARCDVFIHTWSALEPSTPHWSGAPRGARADAAGCTDGFASELRATGARVNLVREEQPPAPADDAAAPDGRPWEDEGLQWGAARQFGWRMNVLGMLRSAQMRRAAQIADGGTYVAAVRLRPDGKEASARSLEPAELPPLWDCVAVGVRLGLRSPRGEPRESAATDRTPGHAHPPPTPGHPHLPPTRGPLGAAA